MNHLDENQLVLFYYGETPAAEGVEEHLGLCDSCRNTYRTLQRVLNTVDGFPVPERPADYEAQVWASVERKLGARRSRWFLPSWRPLIIAVSTAALMIAAFLGGREWQKTKPGGATMADSTQIRERVLLVAVGDHLERSQMILVELTNAGSPKKGRLDISYEQSAAEDLVEENRLYRQTAASVGDTRTASVLDDLERTLLEIAHGPSSLTSQQLEDLRKQIEEQGILFKVKVFGSEMQQREVAPPSVGS